MKVKLDENLGTHTQTLFCEAGHSVHTVRQEGLSGASDQHLYRICSDDNRCLVTLDLDFSNVLRFPPEKTGGIVVLRPQRNPTQPMLRQLVRQFLHAVESSSVEGRLWIVESNRIRIHQSVDDEM